MRTTAISNKLNIDDQGAMALSIEIFERALAPWSSILSLLLIAVVRMFCCAQKMLKKLNN